jgi:predicted RNA polymerase sigma factor
LPTAEGRQAGGSTRTQWSTRLATGARALQRTAEARKAHGRVLALAHDAAERRLLERRPAELDGSAVGALIRQRRG